MVSCCLGFERLPLVPVCGTGRPVWPSVRILTCGMQWAQEVVRSSIPLCHCGRKVGPLLPGCRWFLSSVPSLINLVSQQVFTEHPPWASFVQDEKELKGKEGNFRLNK